MTGKSIAELGRTARMTKEEARMHSSHQRYVAAMKDRTLPEAICQFYTDTIAFEGKVLSLVCKGSVVEARIVTALGNIGTFLITRTDVVKK